MYGKVFEDIFCSTLMDFGGDTAYVFIAMIVLSDENGVIKHTAESLARLICKDLESVKKSLYHLERPDQKSNLKGHDGRRIVPLLEICPDETRGWLVVNKSHYRDKRDPRERRDYMREYMRKYRDSKDVNSRKSQLTELADTDTDTDTDTKKSNGSRKNGARHLTAVVDNSEILEKLPLREGGEFEVRQSLVSELEPLYPAVDIKTTLREMKGWLVLNTDRRKTRRGIRKFIGNWLQGEQEKHGG